jgi:hypothetical protein
MNELDLKNTNAIPEELLTPEHLTAASRRLYEHICLRNAASYDAAARILVIQFLRQRETAETARGHIASEGAVFKDRWGQPRQNPWVDIERQASREMGRLFHLLGWDMAPPDGQLDLFPGGRQGQRY